MPLIDHGDANGVEEPLQKSRSKRRPVLPTSGNIVTVTKLRADPEEEGKCVWCRFPVAQATGPGRPRKFCKRSCRQRDFEARQRARAHGLDEHDILIARSEVNRLKDEIFVLACAVEDAQRDMVDASTLVEYVDIVQSLLAAATSVINAQQDVRP